MKDLGNRIRAAIYKVEELQEELNKRLQALEEGEDTHECMYYTPTACVSCTLHNTPCRDQACMDYWKGVEDKCSKCVHKCNEELPLFIKSQIAEASDFLWKYAMDHKEYMPEENYSEPNWEAYEAGELLHYYINGQSIELVDIQDAMELYTALQQPTDYRETAEDTGTVKYTAEGLYDYGYEPIDDDIPF